MNYLGLNREVLHSFLDMLDFFNLTDGLDNLSRDILDLCLNSVVIDYRPFIWSPLSSDDLLVRNSFDPLDLIILDVLRLEGDVLDF